MRRLPYIAFAACLIGLGCTSTGKKPTAQNPPTGRDDPPPFWADGKAPKGAPPVPVRESDGIIAGLLIDASGRPQPNAVINVSLADALPGTKPIGAEADDQGYFTIKGLKAGSTYFLSVRADDGGRVLGGSAQTQASNTRMLIRLTEGNVSSVTPPPRAHPGTTSPFAPDKNGKTKLDPPANSVPSPDPIPKGKDPLIDGSDQSWAPGKTPPTRPVAPPAAVAPSNPNVADVTKAWPPPVAIPGSGSGPAKVEPPPPSAPMMSAVPSNSSPLQVGALVAPPERRTNFTVYDLAGNPVEFQNLSDRRLIVIDFWTTTCMPCLRKIPELIELQARYTNYLDIAGIACDDLPWEKRKKAVEGIKDYYLRKSPRPINYNIYLEGEHQEGRVQNQFKVKAYPTLVLLDHGGKELWRGSDVRQLEEAVKYYLQRK